MKNRTARILATILGGWFGLHRYLNHQIALGVLYTFTFGLFGIGWIFDICKAFLSSDRSVQTKCINTIIPGTTKKNSLLSVVGICLSRFFHKKHAFEHENIKVVEKAAFPDFYIVLDVETPNKQNNRISQIGLLLVKEGHIIENHSTLINPEVAFSTINQRITGIDSSIVVNSPKFNEYWNSVKALFENYVVVAHNASFDLAVLCKTLNHYKLVIPRLQYVCTYKEAQKLFPQADRYSLSSLAKYLNIEFSNAHNAESDATVCYQILEKMKEIKHQFSPIDYKFINNENVYTQTVGNDISYADVIDLPFADNFDFVFKNRRFVLTGLFTHVSRDTVAEYITSNDGIITESVSGKTDFLIVGSKSDPAWKYGNYGLKIEKAISLLNENCSKIQIIRESLIADYININSK